MLKKIVCNLQNYSIVLSVLSILLLAVSNNSLGLSNLGLALSELRAADNDVLARENTVSNSGLEVASIDAGLIDNGSRLVDAVHGDSVSGFFDFNSL